MAEPEMHLSAVAVANDVASPENTNIEQSGTQQPTSNDRVYGSFLLGEEEYALAANELVDVINAPAAFTPQPLAPDYLLGIMTLREMTIPVIDLRKMFGMDPNAATSTQQKVAITQYQNHHIGLMFDQTSEVFRSTRQDCQYNQYTSTKARGVTNGAFRLGDGTRVVQLLDTKAIIQHNGNPFTHSNGTRIEPKAVQAISDKGDRRQSIVFHLEPLVLSMCMSRVQEVVFVQEFENLSLASEVLAGTTSIRGTTIPVFDLRAALKLPMLEQEAAERQGRVIVANSSERNFGLLVDDISDILHHYEEDIRDFPVFVAHNAEIFLGCLKDQNGKEILQLDIDKLFQFDDIGAALENCDHLFAQQTQVEEKVVEASQSQTYLTFHIDRLYGLNILEISEVVDFPKKLLQPPLLDQHIEGILSLRDEMINVISAAKLYNIDDAPQQANQIIILKSQTERFGLAISSINSIVHLNQQQHKKLPETMIDRTLPVFEDAENALVFRKAEAKDMQDIIVLDAKAVVTRLENH